ncbi:MAG TPA: XrtA system polysaccharide chain length determinant [Allosphingosinicella sp.]|nr:XrtA system polysaccharide chain length determinant [Allosphingosinicella sp.]
MDGLYEQLRIALHSVWRQRWLALAVAWGIALLGWTVIALIPNSYEAKARIYVQAPDFLPSAAGAGAAGRANDLVMLRQTLISTDNLEKVVRRTDLNTQVASDKDLAAQVAALRKSIKVTPQPDDVFEITATAGIAGFSNAQNARTAAAVVQTLIDAFVEDNAAGDRAKAGQTLEFLDQELNRREGELQKAEQRRVDFETRFMGLLPGEGSIEQRLTAARTELTTISQQLLPAKAAVDAVKNQLADTPPTVSGPGGEGGAAGQIAALQTQISQLQARGWKDRHPDIVAARAEIARLKPQADAERRTGVPTGSSNPLYVSLRGMLTEREGQMAALVARRDQLQSDMAALAAKRSSEPEVVAEQARLNRDYDVMKAQYGKMLEDREQLRLRNDVNSKTDAFKFRIIDRPSIPTIPATPNRPIFLTLILIVAVGGGLGAAFARTQLQTTFPTLSRLEQLTGMTVLGAVSDVATDAVRAVARQRLRLFAGAGGALGAVWLLLMAVEFWQRSTVA